MIISVFLVVLMKVKLSLYTWNFSLNNLRRSRLTIKSF